MLRRSTVEKPNGLGKMLWRRRCGLIAASIAVSALMIDVRVRHLMLDGLPSRRRPLASFKNKTKPKIVAPPEGVEHWKREQNCAMPHGSPPVRSCRRRSSAPTATSSGQRVPPRAARVWPSRRARRRRRGICRARKPLVFRPKSRFQAHKLSRRPLPWDSRPAARPARSSGCLETGKCTEPIFSRWILAGSIFSPTEVGFQRLWPERLSPTRPAQRRTFAGYLGPARDGAPGSGRCYARRY